MNVCSEKCDHPDWDVRQANANDIPFIYGTWSKSYRYDSSIGKSCRNAIFFIEYNKVIDHILAQEDTKVWVSTKKNEPDVIFAYMVVQGAVLHYAFTKELFHKMGIAKSLWTHAGKPLMYSHRTYHVQQLLESHDNLTFNPFVLFKQKRN